MPVILAFFSNLWSNYSTTIIMYVAIAIAVIGGYFYWHHLVVQNAELQDAKTQLTQTVNDENKTISQLQTDFAKAQKDLDDLNKKYNDLTTDEQVIDKNFDIGSITDKNKSDIEKQQNSAFNNMFTDISKQSQPTTFAGSN